MRTVNNNYCEVMGSSIGGGSIQIIEVNENEVDFTGIYETLIVTHKDVPGVINSVTSILYSENINVAFMRVFRNQKGQEATMIFEMDNKVNDEIIENIKKLELVYNVICISPAKIS
jgi:L-serine dehydratase